MTRKHIAMVSIPAPGHVNPSLEVIRELSARGHRVTYANDPSFRSVIEDTGAELKPYNSTLPEVNTGKTGSGGKAKSWEGDVIDQLGIFLDDYISMLPQLEAAYAQDRPDLFLWDIAGSPARILAQRWGIPIIQLSPTYVAWDGYEEDMKPFIDGLKAEQRGRDYFRRRDQFLTDNGITTAPDDFFGRPQRCVVLIPKVMQPNADRVDESVYTFTGPALAAGSREGNDGGWQRPAGADRILLVSLGTAFTDQPEFYQRCIEAYGNLDGWHVVLQIGRHVDPAVLGEVPGNVEVHRWVPQLSILRQADAFITHAGMGGSSEGLYTGTPMIAVPQAVDQFQNADALVAAGVAVRLDTDAATADELRRALAAVTAPAVVARAAEISAELKAAGGARAAADIIESCL
jgi:MGT family glycosyltransferase